MKTWMIRFVMFAMIGSMFGGCASSRMGKKRGCPSNSANMGAERVLAGEKPEKRSKYKVRGMN